MQRMFTFVLYQNQNTMVKQSELVKKYAAAFAAIVDKLEAENIQISVETTRNKHCASARFTIYSTESILYHEASFEIKDFGNFQKFESRVQDFPTKELANEAEFMAKVNKVIRTLFGSSAPQLEVHP